MLVVLGECCSKNKGVLSSVNHELCCDESHQIVIFFPKIQPTTAVLITNATVDIPPAWDILGPAQRYFYPALPQQPNIEIEDGRAYDLLCGCGYMISDLTLQQEIRITSSRTRMGLESLKSMSMIFTPQDDRTS